MLRQQLIAVAMLGRDVPAWTQTPKEVTFLLPFPPDGKAKDVKFKLTSKEVMMTFQGETLLSGAFFYSVRADDSTWEVEDLPGTGGKRLRVELAKTKGNVHWDCCFLSEIDETITNWCFMDVSIGGRKMGRIVYGLYGNAYPKTVENFRCLCTGEMGAVRLPGSKKKAPPLRLHYKGCDFFRIVPGFLCQGGDITHHPEGHGGRSIYGGTGVFDDEGFKIKHKGAGDLLMATAGIRNNCHSQFAVAMDKYTEFETRHVIFGKVLDGMDLLKVMELEGSGEGITKRKVTIVDCGELDASGKEMKEAAVAAMEQAVADHGLAPKTDGYVEAMKAMAVGDAAKENEEEDDEQPVIEEVEDDDDGPVLEEEEVPPKGSLLAPMPPDVIRQEEENDENDGPMLEVQ